MQRSTICKVAILALMGICDLLILANYVEGVYLFTVEPDPNFPMSFLYIPLVFSLMMLVTAVVSLVRVCVGRPYAAAMGIFLELWLAWMCLSCLMLSVDNPAAFVILAIPGILALGLALWIKRRHQKERQIPAAPANDTSPFQKEKAEYCWDAAAAEYCLLYHRDVEHLTELDREQIYVYSGLWMGYFVQWAIRQGLGSPILLQQLSPADLGAIQSGEMQPDQLMEMLDYQICRKDFSPAAWPFIDDYFPHRYFNDYIKAIRQDGLVYCVAYSAAIRERLEQQISVQYRDFSLRQEEIDLDADQARTIFWPQMNAHLTLLVSKGVDEAYVERCIQHLQTSSHWLLQQLEEQIVAERQDRGLPIPEPIHRDSFLRQFRPDRMLIYRPYGQQPAYCIGGEADFEEEHGYALCIRGNQIVTTGYRYDIEHTSPWHDVANAPDENNASMVPKTAQRDVMLPFVYGCPADCAEANLEAGCIDLEAYGILDGTPKYLYASYFLKHHRMYESGDYDAMLQALKDTRGKEVQVRLYYKKGRLVDFQIQLESLAQAMGDNRFLALDKAGWAIRDQSCIGHHGLA